MDKGQSLIRRPRLRGQAKHGTTGLRLRSRHEIPPIYPRDTPKHNVRARVPVQPCPRVYPYIPPFGGITDTWTGLGARLKAESHGYAADSDTRAREDRVGKMGRDGGTRSLGRGAGGGVSQTPTPREKSRPVVPISEAPGRPRTRQHPGARVIGPLGVENRSEGMPRDRLTIVRVWRDWWDHASVLEKGRAQW